MTYKRARSETRRSDRGLTQSEMVNPSRVPKDNLKWLSVSSEKGHLRRRGNQYAVGMGAIAERVTSNPTY